MTDQELLLQPEESYMDDGQLAYFQRVLGDNKALITSRLQSYHSTLKDSIREADFTDLASNEEHRSISLAMMNRDREELKRIDSALERIKEGEYGYCEQTGEPIGLRRLLVNPTTKLSVESMRVVEAQGRHRV
ncbi:TraR/DksA family transcriptional regulator (plasmid) [Halopseudomonas sp. SMJS2]|uniref:TraR/DksA family transcriptional regulator n=1 Tax=Halopseudomonas sp. SMJS2 TaxID=3041098 RepID=UPI002453411A|nr:TraR/DksA family transcriptional regulator [Halopseudomonas sp. SMJS2]WGK63536.1 TraR/DksA family transcriptional regulator [Halopseudomonas sp. SMJS2]